MGCSTHAATVKVSIIIANIQSHQQQKRYTYIPHRTVICVSHNSNRYNVMYVGCVWALSSLWNIISYSFLTASISLARVQSSMSRNTLISVFQLTGCFPLPVTHSRRISLLIRSGSSLCLSSIFRTLFPLWSSRRRRPKSWYLVLIFSAMLIILSNPWNLMHSTKVGQSVVATESTLLLH